MSAIDSENHALQSLAASCGVSPAALVPELYRGLRRIAHRQLLDERDGHSLNTTALVHEAWMQLADVYPDAHFESERNFLALSGHLMRRVLVEHARNAGRIKRGAQQVQVTYTDSLQASTAAMQSDELLALDDALSELAALDQRQVEIVQLRYFAGFSIPETAELMNLSATTIKREWTMARAWLVARLRDPQ